ncbi:uncharacterized protein LOC115376450 [Myripristis murdjan]|uniref:uncharacterized protein LOC115376450 n=1 Tax=Myripristis murdjan TaxID=586833 RepID=UPI0011760751|nr:uncharacterized protein LOC115376450 [Myripristis murdjan]
MTIGKNARKSSVRSSIRAPKFLDKSTGFYGRLDEPETAGEKDVETGTEVVERWSGIEDGGREGRAVNGTPTSEVHISRAGERQESGVFDFNDGMMEDDGETLLRRKPSRRSSRWRRSSRRKQKEAKTEEDAPGEERPSLGSQTQIDTPVLEVEAEIETAKQATEEEDGGEGGRGTEPALVHFEVREHADDQVLIRDKKRGRDEEENGQGEEDREGEEERRMRMEQEEGMKMVKRNTMKNYRKALDRAFRRGWEAFITNLYSVTLTPITSSTPPPSSPLSKRKH